MRSRKSLLQDMGIRLFKPDLAGSGDIDGTLVQLGPLLGAVLIDAFTNDRYGPAGGGLRSGNYGPILDMGQLEVPEWIFADSASVEIATRRKDSAVATAIASVP